MSKYAPKQWQSDRFEIECPSGQLCLARKLQMEDIVQLGIIDEMDMFTEFAADMTAAAGGAKSDEDQSEAALGLMKDKERFAKVVEIVDKVVSTTVVEPRIERPVTKDRKGREIPLDPSDFEDDVVYTSYVDFNDKMHIFGTVFSGETIDQFREGPEETV